MKDYQIINSKYFKPNIDINIKIQDESAISEKPIISKNENDLIYLTKQDKTIVNFKTEKTGTMINHEIFESNANVINCFDKISRIIHSKNKFPQDDESEKILQLKNNISSANAQQEIQKNENLEVEIQ